MRVHRTSANLALILAVGFLGLALFGVPLLWWQPSVELAAYLGLLLLFTALVAGLVLRRWLHGQLDWFEPGVFAGFLYLITFGYAGIRSMLDPMSLHPFLQADRGWVYRALFFVMLGVLALWAGYYSNLGLKLHQLLHRPVRERLRATLVIRPFMGVSLYLIGLATRLYMVHAGWYSYLMKRESYFASLAPAQLLIMIELFCGYALVLAWLDYFSHPRDARRRLLAYALLGSEAAWGFFSGMKANFILPLLLVIMVYTYKRGRLPLRALLLTLALIILLYPLNQVYRDLVVSGMIQIRSPLDMVASVPVMLRELPFRFDDPELYLASGYRATLARTSLVQNYALLLKYLDTTGAYWYGRYLWMLPALVFVPRFLWASKPLADKGYWFAVNVWGQDPHVYSSVAVTYPGDLHLQFGLPSLLGGMFLTGVLFRWLYERYARPRSDYSLFFYVFLFYNLMQHETDVAFKLAGTVKAFLVLFALSLVVFRFPRRMAHSAAVPPSGPSPQPIAPTS
ncbi:MAG: hypothetical protein ACE5HL_04590 [Terriglobia bacterium]